MVLELVPHELHLERLSILPSRDSEALSRLGYS